ncbi:hypothetical protein J6590_108424 [Homalodisca vitripennis]|nr:hypothetical protein J6590_108424 [Homalodisca vitripennis]
MHRVDSVFQLEPVTEQDIVKVVQDMRGGSAPGLDDLPVWSIKENIQVLKFPLSHVINNSFRQGIYPVAFKSGKVIPIYKGGPKNQCISFRPITLASVLAKILEKCVRKQFQNYVTNHGFLYGNQFGFRSDKNLNDNLFSFTKKIHDAVGRNKKVLIVFIDLAKAFDTVNRELLVKKLVCIGVRGTTLEWFKNYLSERYQVVSILGNHSLTKQVEYGVIQGSTLGPLLFLIYINNIGKINLLDGQIFLYADDTALLFEGSSWGEAYGAAERGLRTVKQWFDQNQLTVNLHKTKCMAISLRADGDPVNLTLKLHTCAGQNDCDCETVERVSDYKYLGVIFDSRLKWTAHVQLLKNRLRKFIYIFSVLNKILTPALMKTVYHAYVQSLLQFGIIAWGGAYKTILLPLHTSQKAIMKAALQKPTSYSSELLFNEFKVFNITQLYARTIILYIFKNQENIFKKKTTRTLQEIRLTRVL